MRTRSNPNREAPEMSTERDSVPMPIEERIMELPPSSSEEGESPEPISQDNRNPSSDGKDGELEELIQNRRQLERQVRR